jgi:hypothetical protein
VQATNASFATDSAEGRHRTRIDLFRLGFMQFAPIDVRCGSRVNHQIEVAPLQRFFEWLGKIQIVASERQNIVVVRQNATESGAQTAVFADDGYSPFH